MKNINEETIDILNPLIETAKDGANGFKVAADDAKDAELKALFDRYSAERQGIVRELQQRVRSLGGDPDKSGSLTGSIHRGWINLKTAISSHEPHAVLEECERGEDAAVKAYREALEKLTDPTTRDLVSRQFASVLAAHNRVRDLRDSPVYQHA